MGGFFFLFAGLSNYNQKMMLFTKPETNKKKKLLLVIVPWGIFWGKNQFNIFLTRKWNYVSVYRFFVGMIERGTLLVKV